MSMLPLNQAVTYWSVASVDSAGDPTYDIGVLLPCRWVQKDGLVTNNQGDDQKTEYIVYTECLIPKRSLAVLEDLENVATPPDGARKIMGITNNPSMSTLIKHVM